MKYALDVGSDLIKIGSGIQKLIRGIHRYTERMEIA
jgi:hypothetical protein